MGSEMCIRDRCDRRVCCKHLSKNWKRKFPGPLMLSLFWRACGAYSTFTFRKAMQTLQKVNPEAREWLADLRDQSTWTKHKFYPVVACDVNQSNFVESFNATLGIDRCRPVLTLLECNTHFLLSFFFMLTYYKLLPVGTVLNYSKLFLGLFFYC